MMKSDSGQNQAGAANSRRRILVPAIVAVSLLIWGGWAWSSGQSYRSAMIEIRSQMAAGRFALAASRLATVLRRWPRSDEAAYLLGVCEQQQGQDRAAARTWARVEPGSPNSERALQSRRAIAIQQGATERVREVCRPDLPRPPERANRRASLARAGVSTGGRVDDAKRLVEERWEHLGEIGEGAMEPGIKILQMHIELADTPASAESLRAYIEHASRQQPDDDRVWLSRANLAIREGELAEAERWLNACQRRRSEDVPVWKARLSWAMAANRRDVVLESLNHLPAGAFSDSQVHRIAAWMCSRQGDVASEQRELEQVIAADPADLSALDRLTQLAERGGNQARAAELRRMSAEVVRLQQRYTKLYERKQPVRNAIEMARLAEKLGRRFEASAFLTVAVAENPGRDDLVRELKRLSQTEVPTAQPHGTLADALGHELSNGMHDSPAQRDK